MCIAIVTTPGKMVDSGKLWRGWSNNKDGAGFAFVNDQGVVQIKKGYMEYNPFQSDLMKMFEKFGDKSPFLVHCRWATQGSKTKDNTHPFSFRPRKGPAGAFIHNGTMFQPTGPLAGRAADSKSDSRVFGSVLNNVLELDVILKCKEKLEAALTTRNKVAFLFDDYSTVILNEKEGFWDDGIWYSNGSCNYNVRERIMGAHYGGSSRWGE